jgi:hypothetical protein
VEIVEKVENGNCTFSQPFNLAVVAIAEETAITLKLPNSILIDLGATKLERILLHLSENSPFSPGFEGKSDENDEIKRRIVRHVKSIWSC